jgi:hypothetical protein
MERWLYLSLPGPTIALPLGRLRESVQKWWNSEWDMRQLNTLRDANSEADCTVKQWHTSECETPTGRRDRFGRRYNLVRLGQLSAQPNRRSRARVSHPVKRWNNRTSMPPVPQ